jgi:hypothetical protein
MAAHRPAAPTSRRRDNGAAYGRRSAVALRRGYTTVRLPTTPGSQVPMQQHATEHVALSRSCTFDQLDRPVAFDLNDIVPALH